jgi:thiol-disulfide isomerase/thioredoxin
VVSPIWETVAIAGWAVLVLNLLLTLRLVRWLRSYEAGRRADDARTEIPELPIGEPVPEFRAKDLSGRAVRSQDYQGREVALVFVSSHCGICRREMPRLQALAATARQGTGAEIVLINGDGAGEAQSWVASLRDEDKVELTTRVLVASMRTSEFQARYNPRGLTPYFCHIDASGNLTARGGLHTPAWADIARRWDAASSGSRRYRLCGWHERGKTHRWRAPIAGTRHRVIRGSCR